VRITFQKISLGVGIKSFSEKNTVTLEELLNRFYGEPECDVVKYGRLSWFEHVERKISP